VERELKMKKNIHLQIDEMVVDGVNIENAETLGRIVEAELARLIAANGLSIVQVKGLANQDKRIDSVKGGSITVSEGDRTLGTNIASSIYHTLNNSG
jgi:hypothetical protein